MSKKVDPSYILRRFFEEPNRPFHIREIARMAAVNPLTAGRYLEGYRKEGLLTKSRERGHVLYRASGSRLFIEEKKHYNIIRLLASGAMDYLEGQLNYPHAVILFGSCAKGENTRGSDIDLFILSESKKPVDLSAFEKKLHSSFQMFVYTRKEFEEMKKSNKELLNNILNGVRISGFLEVF